MDVRLGHLVCFFCFCFCFVFLFFLCFFVIIHDIGIFSIP